MIHSILSRRAALRQMAYIAGAIGVNGLISIERNQTNSVMCRPIPRSGEQLPVVGLGTWQTFDVGIGDTERRPLKDVLKIMQVQGAAVIDSSPMYGRSEQVVGDLTAESGHADHFFYATKVWTEGRDAGIRQMHTSMRKMRRKTMDLMQIHNLVDWRTHIRTLYDWKAEGHIRYIGITHYTDASHERLERVLREERIDFLQCNYSIVNRHAEKRLLSVAADQGVAVIINRPFGGGGLFGRVRGKALPEWAGDWDMASWGQFFLKYLLGHPAVNCVIPGTSKARHMRDNVGAGMGRLPDRATRQKMVRYMESL